MMYISKYFLSLSVTAFNHNMLRDMIKIIFIESMSHTCMGELGLQNGDRVVLALQ